jgi:membrane associated rhomboid family serine protease
MIADRPYMRDTYNPPRVVPILIGVLIVAFVIQSVILVYGNTGAYKQLIAQLALTVDGIKHGRVWQLVTFQFLHSAPWPLHVLFNCLGLYFFGRSVESTLGAKKFLVLYLVSGVMGGLLQVLTTAVLPKHEDLPVVGASAGVSGIIAIFCMFYPVRELVAWIYFFPVTIRAIYLLWFLGLFSLFGTVIPMDNVAHAAHLGGILFGVAYVRWLHESDRLAAIWSRLLRPRRSRPIVKVRFPRGHSWEADSAAPRAKEDTDFISKEVDPILEKISAHGIHSLTEREREILEKARSRMGKM